MKSGWSRTGSHMIHVLNGIASGTQFTRCGCVSIMNVRSRWQLSTIFISDAKRPTAVTGSESVFHEKRLAVAVAMYFDPPHSSFEDRDDVSDEKSARSTHAVLRPRVAPSSATPQPVAPPPMTRTSNS